MKEIDSEGSADEEQLLGVDGGFVEEALQGALGHANAFHQPLVGVTLAAQFVANKVAYVYLHSGCYFLRVEAGWMPTFRFRRQDACIPVEFATESTKSFRQP